MHLQKVSTLVSLCRACRMTRVEAFCLWSVFHIPMTSLPHDSEGCSRKCNCWIHFDNYNNLLNITDQGDALCSHMTHTVFLLTFSQTTNFSLFQIKGSADDNFKFDENDRKFSKQVENTEGKGEIARYKQFLLFSVFPKG